MAYAPSTSAPVFRSPVAAKRAGNDKAEWERRRHTRPTLSLRVCNAFGLDAQLPFLRAQRAAMAQGILVQLLSDRSLYVVTQARIDGRHIR